MDLLKASALYRWRVALGGRLEDTQARFPELEQDIKFLALADPSGNLAYLPWAASQVSKGGDPLVVRQAVDDFHRLRSQLGSKDIYSYPDLAKLQEAIQRAGDFPAKAEQTNARRDGYRLLGYVGGTEIYEILSPFGSMCLGRGTQWCIAGISNNAFADYTNDNRIFFLLDPSEKKETARLLHRNEGGAQVWEADDKRVPLRVVDSDIWAFLGEHFRGLKLVEAEGDNPPGEEIEADTSGIKGAEDFEDEQELEEHRSEVWEELLMSTGSEAPSGAGIKRALETWSDVDLTVVGDTVNYLGKHNPGQHLEELEVLMGAMDDSLLRSLLPFLSLDGALALFRDGSRGQREILAPPLAKGVDESTHDLSVGSIARGLVEAGFPLSEPAQGKVFRIWSRWLTLVPWGPLKKLHPGLFRDLYPLEISETYALPGITGTNDWVDRPALYEAALGDNLARAVSEQPNLIPRASRLLNAGGGSGRVADELIRRFHARDRQGFGKLLFAIERLIPKLQLFPQRTLMTQIFAALPLSESTRRRLLDAVSPDRQAGVRHVIEEEGGRVPGPPSGPDPRQLPLPHVR